MSSSALQVLGLRQISFVSSIQFDAPRHTRRSLTNFVNHTTINTILFIWAHFLLSSSQVAVRSSSRLLVIILRSRSARTQSLISFSCTEQCVAPSRVGVECRIAVGPAGTRECKSGSFFLESKFRNRFSWRIRLNRIFGLLRKTTN